jgi:hypothetical protein
MPNNTLERTGNHGGCTMRAVALCARAGAAEHRLLTPEYAYLTDVKHRRWKALRAAKAKSALKTLARIAPGPATEIE